MPSRSGQVGLVPSSAQQSLSLGPPSAPEASTRKRKKAFFLPTLALPTGTQPDKKSYFRFYAHRHPPSWDRDGSEAFRSGGSDPLLDYGDG